MSAEPGGGGPAAGGGAPSEEEMRAAYEAELSRVSVTDLLVQSTVTLLNVAARRLGPPAAQRGGEADAPGGAAGAAAGRDLEQVRDAIDAVRALLEILERRTAGEVRPLRDALSQLQMAYAAEVRAGAAEGPAAGAGEASRRPEAPAGKPDAAEAPQKPAAEPEQGEEEPRPGPAEASGRLWVPGR